MSERKGTKSAFVENKYRGINQIDSESSLFKMKFFSVPMCNPTKRRVDRMSKKTQKNNSMIGKSIV